MGSHSLCHQKLGCLWGGSERGQSDLMSHFQEPRSHQVSYPQHFRDSLVTGRGAVANVQQKSVHYGIKSRA